MAEDDLKPTFDFSDPNINIVYANDGAVIVGDSEINLYFSDGSPALQDGTQRRISTRIVLSHATFIYMMDFWMTRYDFIRTMYDGTPVSLRDFRTLEPDRYEAAYQKYLAAMKTQEPPDNE